MRIGFRLKTAKYFLFKPPPPSHRRAGADETVAKEHGPVRPFPSRFSGSLPQKEMAQKGGKEEDGGKTVEPLPPWSDADRRIQSGHP